MNAIVWLFNAICEWFGNLGNVDKDCDDCKCDCKNEPLNDRVELTCLDKLDRRNLTCLCAKRNIILRKGVNGKLYITLEQIFWLKTLMDKGQIRGVFQKEIIKTLLKKADRIA